MAYSKTSWFNKPSVASPINATNLNKIENGIDKAIGGVENGWNLLTGSFTYASADTPTFVMNTPVDLTGVIGLGMRIKLTQTTVKYFIVTAITSTTITLYGGTDYTLVNETISNVSYSMVKAPFGFPTSPEKWSVVVTDNARRSQATPTSGVWYNPNGTNIVVPLGLWNIDYKANGYANRGAAAGFVTCIMTLSTTNNGDTLTQFKTAGYSYVPAAFSTSLQIGTSAVLSLPNKTTLFLNVSTNADVASIAVDGGFNTTIIKATCAYL